MKVGMTLSHADLGAPLAEHFGKAKWLAIVDGDRSELVRNAGLDGRWVARELAARGCTDVIVSHVGPGAYSHLAGSGLRVWQGQPGEPANALRRALEEGRLQPLAPEAVASGHAHHGVHGGGHGPR